MGRLSVLHTGTANCGDVGRHVLDIESIWGVVEDFPCWVVCW